MNTLLEKKWYVFYTRPRSEKKANKYLLSLGYKTLLPLRKEYKIWKNRQRKLVEIPLFASYLFVYAYHYEIFDITKVYSICCCIKCSGIPVSIPNNDIMALTEMQNLDVEILHIGDFTIGDKIRLIDGPLHGYEGVLVKMKGGDKFGIDLSCVNFIAIIDLGTSGVEII